MKKYKNSFILLLCTFFLFTLIPSGQANGADRIPKLRIVASTNQLQVGETVEVAIWLQDFIGNYRGLEGLQIRLKYDPSLIQPVGEKNQKFTENGIFPPTSNPTTLVNKIDLNGKVEFAQFLPPKSNSGHFKGYGKLGVVTFKAVKEGTAKISQEKSIVIKPDNAGANIKHETNEIAIVIGKGNPTSDKKEIIGVDPVNNYSIQKDDEILQGFKDSVQISKLSWAKASIAKLVEQSIFAGDQTGNFNPELNITRAEVAKVIVTAFGLDMVQQIEPTFKDIQKTDWYFDYVETAAHYELIKGVEQDGIRFFNPQNYITRAELAVIFSRILNKNKGKLVTTNVSNPFQDIAAQYWAKENILHLYANGIIKGKSKTNFAPFDYVTRAEVSVMLNRLLELK